MGEGMNRQDARAKLGFLGLGAMGQPMVRNLVNAGYTVNVYDVRSERIDASVAAGAVAAPDAATVVAQSDVVLTSLPSSESFVELAESHLLPGARAGQVFVDLGTVTPPETRRLAVEFASRGAALLDAPVSGGPKGASDGTLYIFVGGDETVACQCWSIFEVLGNHVTYCGPSGAGQVAKGVNQLTMGLRAAAYLEAIAFGVRGGLDPALIATAVGGAGDLRGPLRQIAERIAQGAGEHVGVKFRELPYYLREAEESGFKLPLTETLYAFCDAGERVVIDDSRPAPSFWHELVTQKAR